MRVLIAGALLVIGVQRAIGAIRHNPIADVSESEHEPGRLRNRLTQRFPTVMHQLDPDADLPPCCCWARPPSSATTRSRTCPGH